MIKTLASWAPAPNLTVTAIESEEADWIVSVDSRDAEQDWDRASFGFVTGALFGVAMFDAVAGKPVEASIVGAWTLPKPNTVVAFAEGEKVFWDSVNSLCKKTAAGYFCIGAAIVAAAATDSTVAVRLDGQTLTAAGA